MSYAATTNELSISHGYSPIVKRNKKDPFFRGYFVYITEFDRRLGYNSAINSRIGYYDYDSSIKNIDDLTNLVITEGRAGRLDTHITSSTHSFPILRTNLGQIDFGWDQCDVCYILDIAGWSFQPLPNNSNPSDLNQPVVFRKNKVINKTSMDYKIDGYLPNKCFYNLKVENINNCSVVNFSNFMLDEYGVKIEYQSCDLREWHYCMDMHIRIEQNNFNLKKIFSFINDKEREAELFNIIDGFFSSELSKSISDAENVESASIRYVSPSVIVNSPSNLPDFLVIVFDPPNCNGGGSGPPKLQ
jgi:hypothetical protein